VDIGAGGLTTTPEGEGEGQGEGEGEGEGTLDPGQETSTSGDEVAGTSDESLPYTGAGQVSLGGLGGLLLGAGVILLLLVRRRSPED
jgi:LPXTG-motif cell wall-anchored protein